MRKKFASLVLLSVFTAGVTASSAVSASNSSVGGALAQVSDKVGSGEGVVNSGDSKENNGSAENLNNNEEKGNETKDLESKEISANKDNNLEEQSGEKKGLVYTSKEKAPDSKKNLKIAGVVGGAGSGATVLDYGAKKFWDSKNKGKSKVDDDPTNTGTDTFPPQPDDVKKDEPGSGEESPDSDFAAWYKNNLGLSIPLTIVATIFSAYIIWIIIRMIWLEIIERKASKDEGLDYTAIYYGINIFPLIGAVSDINSVEIEIGKDVPFFKANSDNNRIVGPKRVGINALIAITLAEICYWEPCY